MTVTTLPPPPMVGRPEPRPSKPRNRVLGALSVLCALLAVAWGCWTLVDVLGHTSSTIERTLPAVHQVRIDMGGTGRIEIVAEARSDVHLVRRVYQGLRRTRVRETVEDGVLTVHSRCPPVVNTICNASYLVRVPLGTSVVGRNDGGSIVLAGVAGVDVRSDGGRVSLDRVTGVVAVRSGGGRITGQHIASPAVTAHADGGRVELGFVTSPDRIDARSDGGRVVLVLPADAPSYHVDASSDGGRVDVRIATDQRVARTIVAHSDGGGVSIGYAGA